MVEIYKLSIAPKMKSSYPEWRPTRAQKVICYRSLWRAPLSIQLLHVKSTSALNPTWKKKRPIEISSKTGKNYRQEEAVCDEDFVVIQISPRSTENNTREGLYA
jgi:hypothetical protein